MSFADQAAIERDLGSAAELFETGRLEAAAQIYQRLERAAPDDIRAPYCLAIIDIRRGRLARAQRRLEGLLARHPGHVMAQHNLGMVRQQQGDWGGAAAAYEAALELRPEVAETRQALATALTVLGRTDGALGHYRVLSAAPQTRWDALTRIALIAPATIDDADLAAMSHAAQDDEIDCETRIGLCFALGEALDRRGRSEEAFAAFAAGNRAKRAGLAWAEAAAANAETVRRLKALFTPALLAEVVGKGSRAARPIFIVGFPRSGSTLVEQILAGHPDVQAMGETAILPQLVEARYPAGPRLSAARLGEIGEAYLAALRARGWDGRARVVDKTLENYLHVGLIHVLFPRAVVLHAVRDPVETGFSCFRQLFASGNETLYDLADIGAEHRRYREMMDHWRTLSPGRVAEVSHEALVADPEPQVRRLAEAAGLAFDPAMLLFHERERAVATASAAQVRRPISAAGVGRWRRYAAQLQPLIAALGDLTEERGAPRGASDGT